MLKALNHGTFDNSDWCAPKSSDFHDPDVGNDGPEVLCISCWSPKCAFVNDVEGECNVASEVPWVGCVPSDVALREKDDGPG